MGWKLARLELCGYDQVKPNEEKDVCIVLKEEKRAVIHGVIKFPSGKPVKDAVVKLFKKKDSKDCCDTCDLEPVTFTYTDECGQFLFGVDSDTDYVLKAFYYKPEKEDAEKKPDKPEKHDKYDKYDKYEKYDKHDKYDKYGKKDKKRHDKYIRICPPQK